MISPEALSPATSAVEMTEPLTTDERRCFDQAEDRRTRRLRARDERRKRLAGEPG